MISGKIGLMQAVKKFEPEKGFRLATYTMVDQSINSRIHIKILEFG